MYNREAVTKFGRLSENKNTSKERIVIEKSIITIPPDGLSMNNRRINELPLPIDDNEPATKIYVDTTRDKLKRDTEVSNPFTFQNDEFIAKDKIDMRGFSITNVKLEDVNKLLAFEQKNGGFIAKDHIYMRSLKLGGLKEPVSDREAATKGYVDNTIANSIDKFVDKPSGDYKLDSHLNLLGSTRIYNVPDPTKDDEVCNRRYVDNNRAFYTEDGKTFKAKVKINMEDKKINNLKDATDSRGAVSKGYVDNAVAAVVGGAFIESQDKTKYLARNDLDLNNFRIMNVHNPLDDDEATNKEYVDTEISNAIGNEIVILEEKINNLEAVGFSGDMKNKKIRNVREPTNVKDVATKGYVDKKKVELKIQIDGDIIRKQREIKEDYERIIVRENNKLEDYIDDKYSKIVQNDAFINENGYYLATKGLNMGFKKILNVSSPWDDHEAVPKSYVDEEIKKIVAIQNKNFHSSNILIRAEAIGPVVGIEELSPGYDDLLGVLKGIVRARIEGGTGGYLVNGKTVQLTNFYFGKYHGGIFKYLTMDKEFENPSLFLFPFDGSLFKFSAVLKYVDNERGPPNNKIGIKIFTLSTKTKGIDNVDINRNSLDSLLFNSKDIYITTVGTANINFDCSFIDPPLAIENCNYFGLLFLKSDPKIEKVSLTLVANMEVGYPPGLFN